MSEHHLLYKNSRLNGRDFQRQRRQELKVDLRRQKRDEVLSKKRSLDPECIGDETNSDDELPSTISDDAYDSLQHPFSITKESIDAMNQNHDQYLIIENAQKIRKILSKDPQPPFDLIINSGLIPRFVELLDRSDNPTLQFEVAWILTNICSGTTEQTKVVVDHGAVPKLVSLMSSQDLKVCEQAMWALGNIIGEGPELRDMIIGYNFVPALLKLIRPDLDVNFLRNITWVLVNIARNKEPPPHLEVIHQIVPALLFLIQMKDFAILSDTAWAISYITELGPDYAQLIIDSRLTLWISPLLAHSEYKIQAAAIRALGSIVTGDDVQTQAVVDAGALPLLKILLQDDKIRDEKIVRDALWCISNISAGSIELIQAIVDNQIIPLIAYHMRTNVFAKSKEAAWTIYNMSLSASSAQLGTLVDVEIPTELCKLGSFHDNTLTKISLEALDNILSKCEERQSDIVESIEKGGGLTSLETLQTNLGAGDNYELLSDILEKYFYQDIISDDFDNEV